MSSTETNTAVFASQRILIVDTDAEATEVLATLLRLSSPGVTTACAHSARTAVALAQEFQPDVAIIDLGSRTGSGVVLAGAVLAACAGTRPLMIALTSNPMHGDGIEPPSLFDHVLPKPLEFRALVVLIARGVELVRH
jgi:CheY-like chemotaxis protein